jgi:L-asparaginase type II
MWISAAFISAMLLGLYDVAKKRSLSGNAVIPVLFLNTLFSSIIFLPIILNAEFSLGLFGGTMFDSVSGGWHAHMLVAIKAAITLSSWLFGYYAIKHLPLTIIGPVNATRPVVVLVGAMRPSTAIGADGPANLYNAVVVASSPESKNRGVVVCMNDKVYGARDVTKTNTTSVETFQSPNFGAIGFVHNGKVRYNVAAEKAHPAMFNIDGLTSLPKVGIAYGYSNVQGDVVNMMVKSGYKGIVYAGVGNGNIHKNVFPELENARKKGVLVVRSSRVPTGATTLDAEVDDNKYQFVASWGLNPQKARILLMLALTKTDDWKKIQEYFNNY